MREWDYMDEETFLEYKELKSVRAGKRMMRWMDGLDVKSSFEWSKDLNRHL